MQGRAEGKLRDGIRVSGLTSERTGKGETVMVDTPLRGVPGWTDEHVERLAQAWITTAEQVVAMRDGGRPSLAGGTARGVGGRGPTARGGCAQRAPADGAGGNGGAVDTSEYGLGVPRRPPDDRGP